ncbi:MAG TPA: hydrogenase maturation protein [Bacillota bacterium]|nr:hydrogenase maturation protein [Bacillota bacterium]
MKILFITTAHNSMSRRAYVELTDIGHKVDVLLALRDEEMIQAVHKNKPDLIVAPMLKKAIPEEIWRNHICMIVHPGIKGDRGPSSLDWAILNGLDEWGVTLLQANKEMDAGDIWASINFKMRNTSKSNLYRHEATEAAMKALLLAVKRFEQGDFIPEPLDYSKEDVKGNLHITMKQSHRSINWSESTEQIVRNIRCADSQPGVLDRIAGEEYYLFGAHEEDRLKGEPGRIIACRDGAICRATGDGAIWITHLKRKGTENKTFFKVPASLELGDKLDGIPEIPLAYDDSYQGKTFREIWYEEKNQVGYLHFHFYNGAMSTDQCNRLRLAYLSALKRSTKVLVLMGGQDFWSNGIHLNVIEASENPADESWKNINAMNDLIREIITTESKLVISSMQGNAGAGGVILALAADFIYARKGVVVNPHYKGMGDLYGSEYWTYLLPRRVGATIAHELTEKCISLGTSTALQIGLIDDAFGENTEEFCSEVSVLAEKLAHRCDYQQLLEVKRLKRIKDEQIKPLEQYRKEELVKMWENFYSPDSLYHEARKRFVYKTCPTCSEVKVNHLSNPSMQTQQEEEIYQLQV